MAKLLRPKDRLLLALAFIGNLVEEIPTPRDYLDAVYGFYPREYRRNNYLKAFDRSLRTGNIRKLIKDGKPYWRLTTQGKKRLVRDFPLLKWQSGSWDRRWRVVAFDIKEKEKDRRRQLRGKLLELGFGMLQKSVYISPFDVAEDLREYLEGQGLGEKAYVLVADSLFAGDDRDLAEKVWSLEKLNEEYDELLAIWERGESLGEEPREDLIRKIRSRYMEILAADPCLPQELLPEIWMGGKARRLVLSFSS